MKLFGKRVWVLCVMGLLALGIAWALFTYITSVDDRPSVVLITVDTLRADRLGCYGNSRQTSPTIDRLAAEGVLFENAMSQAPVTGPSHISILTGKYPLTHGVLQNGWKLDPDAVVTWAQIMKDYGYRTAAFVSCSVLTSSLNYNKGFELYSEDFSRAYSEGGYERTASETNREVLEWIKENCNEKFFLWVHYFDPHAPYRAPPPYGNRFDPEYRGEAKADNAFLYDYVYKKKIKLPERDVEHIKALYDEEVLFVDAHIGQLLKTLRDCQTDRDTLVVVVSDHGEELYDHDYFFGHSYSLYDGAIRIPLVLWCPELFPEGRRIKKVVQSIDILPTILDYLKIPVPSVEGESLQPLIGGREQDSGGEAFVQREPFLALPTGRAYSLRTARRHYINFSEAPDELYDVQADRGERRNIISSKPAEAAQLKKRLLDLRDTLKGESEIDYQEMDPQARRILKALGYLR